MQTGICGETRMLCRRKKNGYLATPRISGAMNINLDRRGIRYIFSYFSMKTSVVVLIRSALARCL